MPGYIGTVTGSAMHFRGTSNLLVAILDVTIVSGLIVHVGPVFGCVVLVTFVMFWMSRSATIESVKSAFSVEVKVEVTIIKFY